MLVNRRTVLKTALSGVSAMCAAPYLARPGFAQTPLHTLKIVYPDSPAHPLMQILGRFGDNVFKKTDGAIKIQVFTTGQLGTQSNMLTGMQTGIIDLCAHTSGFIQTLYPKFMVVDLPFLFKDAASAERVLDGPIGPQLLTELPSKGIYGLSYGPFGWRVLPTTGREVPDPDAMKGLKIRVQPGAIFAAMFTTLNAIPVQVDLSEVYLALSQKTIEAVETPSTSLISSKHYEVVKSVNLTNHVYNPGVLMASKRKMDTLESKHQEAIRQAAIELTPDWRKTIAEKTVEADTYLKELGISLVNVDRPAFRKALEPVYTQFRGVIGTDLMDAVMKQASS